MSTKTTFLLTLLLALTVTSPVFAQKGNRSNNSKNPHNTTEEVSSLKCKAPAFLRPGDKIALITPSYSVSSERINQAAAVIRSWGFVPVIGAYADGTDHGMYSGTDKERLTDLRWALRDTTIKAIICNRGGYGAIHFYGRLKSSELADSPKWIVGFSDITTLHCMEAASGVMSIHGTIGSHVAFTGGTDATCTVMRDLLTGTIPQYELPSHPLNRKGHAEGTLVGGNLSTFIPLLGSQMDCLKNKDIILFIEEVGETMHHIDRMFNMLRIHGVLSRCKGVILGDFSDIDNDIDYPSAEALFLTYLQKNNIPVVCGFPGGHCKLNLPLVMGAPVTLDVRNDGASITFNIKGNQQVIRTKDLSDSLTDQTPQTKTKTKTKKKKKKR
jgi:muramoyltetrapeptide carboxypeptidase